MGIGGSPQGPSQVWHVPYILPVCFCRCTKPFIASRAGPKQVRNTLSQAQDTKCTFEALGNTGDPILCRQLDEQLRVRLKDSCNHSYYFSEWWSLRIDDCWESDREAEIFNSPNACWVAHHHRHRHRYAFRPPSTTIPIK